MTSIVAMFMLLHAWWTAATAPSAERVEITVTLANGEFESSSYAVWFEPLTSELALAIGPLVIEAGEAGLWAAHQRDPTTVAVLTSEPVRTLGALGVYLPPTPTPAASLAMARPDEPWLPIPQANRTTWEAADILLRGPWRIPVGVRLTGTCEAGSLVAVVRWGHVESLTLTPKTRAGQPRGVHSIEVRASHQIIRERVRLDRGAARVTSLFSLRPLGPAIGRGQRIPHGLTINDGERPARYDELPWPDNANTRLTVIVRADAIEAQATLLAELDSILAEVSQQLAGDGFTPIALLDGPITADPASRARSAAEALKGAKAFAGVYAITDQRLLIERMEQQPGQQRSRAIAVLAGRDGIIRSGLSLDGDRDAVRSALIDAMRSDSARGR